MSKSINVLFIDDDTNLLGSIERLFSSAPFGLITTNDCQEAVAIIEQEPIKVVVCDQRMPDIPGTEFLNDLKNTHPHIIRIIFTAYADFDAVRDAINLAGVYRFINKPWDPDDLQTTIEQALKHFDLAAQNQQLLASVQINNKEVDVLNKKLNAMYETQKEFSARVTKELGTPLANIKSSVDVVLSGKAGPLTDDQKEFLRQAKTSVEQLTRTIADLVELSKLEATKSPLKLKEADINAVINGVVDIQKNVVKRSDLYLIAELDSSIPSVVFDPEKIIKVLENLINNAVRFTKTGGIIVSSETVKHANHIKISVKDTGTGIDEGQMAKLFQKFQQFSKNDMRTVDRTGLGLSICQEIIKQHGGKMLVESQLGEGSCFAFILPIVERRKI